MLAINPPEPDGSVVFDKTRRLLIKFGIKSTEQSVVSWDWTELAAAANSVQDLLAAAANSVRDLQAVAASKSRSYRRREDNIITILTYYRVSPWFVILI